MEITNKKIEEIKPYSRNAKKHSQKQIRQVANSISEFGYCQPIVVDKNNVIIVEIFNTILLDKESIKIYKELLDENNKNKLTQGQLF